jgi:hypothetical protein
VTLSNGEDAALARLLGMMGPQHDGEAFNAARMAGKLVREHDCT